jgi:hypothetical protein
MLKICASLTEPKAEWPANFNERSIRMVKTGETRGLKKSFGWDLFYNIDLDNKKSRVVSDTAFLFSSNN